MPVFDHRFIVRAPVSAVRAFHQHTSALRRLSPPPIIVQLHRVQPLAENSLAEFTMWFGPIPVRWKALHRDVSPDGFTDIQVSGPLQAWAHTHRFQQISETESEVRDRVIYEYPRGLRGLAARLLFSPPGLWALFTYRKFATRAALNQARPAR